MLEDVIQNLLALDAIDVTDRLQDVAPGSVYVCVKGAKFDGHANVQAAFDSGAVAVVVQDGCIESVAQNVRSSHSDRIFNVADTAQALGVLAAAIHGRPAKGLLMLGVTGTNGKTTTTQILAHILRSCDYEVMVFGTLEGGFTTPLAPDLQRRPRRVSQSSRGNPG